MSTSKGLTPTKGFSPKAGRKKVILIRLDKIGDLISTLPVDDALDPRAFDVTWVVQKGMGSLIDLGEKKRKYIELDKTNSKLSRSLLKKLLFDEAFDIAISFQSPWWINFELFMAGIPKRIGPLSSWHSFIFLTEGIRQKRSQALKHEFDYNLELVQILTGPVLPEGRFIFRLQKPVTSRVLERHGLTSRYVVVHPGMAGSALNWPQHKYVEKIKSLLDESFQVVITGTASDEKYIDEIRAAFFPSSNAPYVSTSANVANDTKGANNTNTTNNGAHGIKWLVGKLDFESLIEVLYFSEFVIAPSTGVAHLAASLDKRLLAIYPPVQVQRPTRWGPRAPSAERVHVFAPSVTCPAKFKCLGAECPHYNCMEKISIELTD